MAAGAEEGVMQKAVGVNQFAVSVKPGIYGNWFLAGA